jgi:hypothetical protein
MKVEKFENSNVDRLQERLEEIIKEGGRIHQVLPTNQRAVYLIIWLEK